MRFTVSLPVFVLAAATAAFADKCAVCPDSVPPGVSEIAWGLVWNRDVADNQMFCGYAIWSVFSAYAVHTFHTSRYRGKDEATRTLSKRFARTM